VWGLSDEEEERVKKEYEVDERIARIQKEELDEQRKQEANTRKITIISKVSGEVARQMVPHTNTPSQF